VQTKKTLARRLAARLYYGCRSSLHNHRVNQIHRRHRELHAQEYEQFSDILSHYHQGGGLKHAYQPYKLWSLQQLLDRKQPHAIVEFGTGSTTPVIVSHASGREDCRATCVDESEEWLALSRQLSCVRSADAQKVEFRHCPKLVDTSCQPVEVRYDFTPTCAYDFVLIDGPSFIRADGTSDKSAINTNIFELAERHLPETIVVDIRKATVQAIVDRLSDAYECRVSDVIRGNLRDNYEYFTVFERR